MPDNNAKKDNNLNLLGFEAPNKNEKVRMEKRANEMDAGGFEKMKRNAVIVNLSVVLFLVVFFSLPFFIPALYNFFFTGWGERSRLAGYVFYLFFVFTAYYDSRYFILKKTYEKKHGLYEKSIERQEKTRKAINRFFYLLAIVDIIFVYYEITWLISNNPETIWYNVNMLTGSIMGFLPILAVIIFTSFKIKK